MKVKVKNSPFLHRESNIKLDAIIEDLGIVFLDVSTQDDSVVQLENDRMPGDKFQHLSISSEGLPGKLEDRISFSECYLNRVDSLGIS